MYDYPSAVKYMIIGCALLTLMDAFAKLLGDSITVSMILLARFGLQSLFIYPFVHKELGVPTKKDLYFLSLRGFFIVIATMFFISAITVMPIADALAIFFIMPLIVTLLSPFLLKERFGFRRLIAIIIGLLGVILVVKPSREVFGAYAFMPLGTAFFFSCYLMLTRRLTRTQSDGIAGSSIAPKVTQFYTGIFGVLTTLILMLLFQDSFYNTFGFQIPTLQQWPKLILVGVFATIGHLFITIAFKYAPASVLAPLQYLELIGATFWGWLFFKDIPTITTIFGAIIIVGSGLYIFRREQKSQEAIRR